MSEYGNIITMVTVHIEWRHLGDTVSHWAFLLRLHAFADVISIGASNEGTIRSGDCVHRAESKKLT